MKISTYFKRLRKRLWLWHAIKTAEHCRKVYKQRHYVVEGTDDRLYVINRKTFRTFRRRGLIEPTVTIDQLAFASIYYTSFADGRQPMLPSVALSRRLTYINRAY